MPFDIIFKFLSSSFEVSLSARVPETSASAKVTVKKSFDTNRRDAIFPPFQCVVDFLAFLNTLLGKFHTTMINLINLSNFEVLFSNETAALAANSAGLASADEREIVAFRGQNRPRQRNVMAKFGSSVRLARLGYSIMKKIVKYE